MGKGKEDGVNVFKRYIWLLDTIYNAGLVGISQHDIFQKWERKIRAMGYGEPYNPKTFHNHRRKIEDIFDVSIECTSKNNYRVALDDEKGMAFGEVENWMVNTIAIKNVLVDNVRLRDHIIFEPIPRGTRFLQTILEAIEDSAELTISYKRYGTKKRIAYSVQPYLLRLFRRRWYLVGFCLEMGQIYTFSLDRTENVGLTSRCFKMPVMGDVDIFDNHFGIIWSGNETKTVRIRVYEEQIEYIRNLPLHQSQKGGESGTEGVRTYCEFTYELVITYDFVQELLSQGKYLKVIGPDELKRKMQNHVLAMAKYYAKNL